MPLHLKDSTDLAVLCHGDWRAELASWDIGRANPHPEVYLYTSWLPVQGRYETLLTGPDWLHARMGPVDGEYYSTREAAHAGHRRWLEKVVGVLNQMATEGLLP